MQLSSFLISALAVVSGISPAEAQSQNIFVTGVPVSGGGAVPLRRNINQLQSTGGPQWDLYIRALRSMYDASDSDWKSYFQVAGIHGQPFIQWNGGGARAGNGWGGYCPHGESIFLTWHRPYTLLFEQILVEHAKRLANLYPSSVRSQYVQAANTLRSPYWDWALDAVPDIITKPTVTVRVPNGNRLKTTNMKNPLYTYQFPSAVMRGKYGQWDNRPRILHCPAPDRFPQTANANLRGRPYRQWVYDALTRSTTYEQFASTGANGVSIEQIHNAVHWDAACGNQFLQAELSGFDPFFWLHHTNVDRLWTYYQFMRPGQANFVGSYSGGSRYSTPSGTRITPSSPLNPFYASRGRLHTSSSVSDIRKFGYTYEGLSYWSMSQSQLSASARSVVNRLYGSSTSSTTLRRDLEGRADDGNTTRFFAQVQLDVTQVPRPCMVDVYVSGKRVGGLVVLQQPQTGIINGEFSVDQAADTPQLLSTCSPTKLANTLTDGLQVQIVKHDGSVVDTSTVSSLKLKMVSVPYTPPAAQDDLPTYGTDKAQPASIQSTKDTKALKALNRCPRKLPNFGDKDPQ